MTPSPGIEPEPQWWKVSGLTTEPSLHSHDNSSRAHQRGWRSNNHFFVRNLHATGSRRQANGQQHEITQSLAITFPQKDNLQQCKNYHIISLTSYDRKVMLTILLNRLNHVQKSKHSLKNGPEPRSRSQSIS